MPVRLPPRTRLTRGEVVAYVCSQPGSTAVDVAISLRTTAKTAGAHLARAMADGAIIRRGLRGAYSYWPASGPPQPAPRRAALAAVHAAADERGADHAAVGAVAATDREIDALRRARLVVVVDGRVALTPAGYALLGVQR